MTRTGSTRRGHPRRRLSLRRPRRGRRPKPGYGPPTLTGNTRVTDAQRARAEGRSPIIEPGMQPALITAVLGLLLAGAAAIGEYALAVPLVVLQAVTAAGWFRLNGMWPARQGIVLAFAGALAADAALFVPGGRTRPPRSSGRSVSGCCSASCSGCAATRIRTSGCTG